VNYCTFKGASVGDTTLTDWHSSFSLHGGMFNGKNTSEFIHGTGPAGNRTMLLRGTFGAGSGSCSGGWGSKLVNLPVNKSVMFVTYARRVSSGSAGTWYCGMDHGNTYRMDDTHWGNPYPMSNAVSIMTKSQWYLKVMYLQATDDYSTDGNPGGIWNVGTKTQVSSATRVKWKPGLTGVQQQSFRNFLCYSADAELEYADGGVYICDGTEPSINELLVGLP